MDAEAFSTFGTFVRPFVGEMIELVSPAVGAEFAMLPANSGEMVYRSLFVWNGLKQLEKGLEFVQHGQRSLRLTLI
ncbi:hypothetical protein BMS3Bbin10_00783 [bacterium BMS3Bbin10]|nr:hypothetical protein BMS3Bbin10_00783 [bacterium BMS3Bbin10]